MTRQYRFCIAAFAFILIEMTLITFVDQPLAEYLHTVDSTHPFLIDIFRAYTDLGKSAWYLWPSGFAIILCAILVQTKTLKLKIRKRTGQIGQKFFFLFMCVAVSGIVTDIIKPILGRARPVELVRDHFYGFQPFSFQATFNSMPSGHATTAFALAFALIYLFPRGRVAFIALALVLALSRMMVNAHFLSDVIAGGVVGYLTVFFFQRAMNYNGMFHVIHCIFPIDRKEARH